MFDLAYEALKFVVPLLAMPAFSKEKSSGTLPLLLSSPVRASSIVLGKFLAYTAYYLLAMLYIGTLVGLGAVLIENFDIGIALASWLGLLLVGVSYISISIFVSTFSSHQVIVAVFTIFILFCVEVASSFGQRFPILGDFAFWLSLESRGEVFQRGLIGTDHVLYFIGLSIFFLALTTLRLLFSMRSVRLRSRATAYGVALLALFVFSRIVSLHPIVMSWDVTAAKTESLSEESAESTAFVDGNLQIDVLVNIFDPFTYYFMPERQRNLSSELFDKFERVIGPISVQYKFYYPNDVPAGFGGRSPSMSTEEMAKEFARQNGLRFSKFLTEADLFDEYGSNTLLGRHFFAFRDKDSGSIVSLPTHKDRAFFPNERGIATALKALHVGKKKLAFYSVGGAHSISRRGEGDYSVYLGGDEFRVSALTKGFEVRELDAFDLSEFQYDVVVVVVDGPVSDGEKKELRDYLKAGGAVLLLTDPDYAEEASNVLMPFGASLSTSAISQPKGSFPEDLVFAFQGGGIADFYEELESGEAPVVLNKVSALTVDSQWKPILAATGVQGCSAGAGAATGSCLIAAKRSPVFEGIQGSTLLVVGDTEFLSNSGFNIAEPAAHANIEFADWVLRSVAGGEYPLFISEPVIRDLQLNVDLSSVWYLRIVLMGLIPFLVGLIGIGYLYRRQMK